MRSSSALKQIARDRLRFAYWSSFIVVSIAFFENVISFFKNLIRVLSGNGWFFNAQVYTGVPARELTLSTFFSNLFADTSWIFLLYTLVAPVLLLGVANYFLKLFRGQDAQIKDVIEHFNLFFRAVWLSILLAIIIGLVVLGFFLGAQFLSWIFRFGLGFRVFVMLIAVIVAVIVSLRYSMAYFVLADNPNLTALQALEESKNIMVGEKGSLFVLGLSFIGWFILDAFLGGLLMIFIYPYMIATFTAFYLDITNPAQLTVVN